MKKQMSIDQIRKQLKYEIDQMFGSDEEDQSDDWGFHPTEEDVENTIEKAVQIQWITELSNCDGDEGDENKYSQIIDWVIRELELCTLRRRISIIEKTVEELSPLLILLTGKK